MAWTDRDTQGLNAILTELKGFVERHSLEVTSDLILREQHAEHDALDIARFLGGAP